jgi:cyanophycinase
MRIPSLINRLLLLVFIACISFNSFSQQGKPKGKLFIIGGGSISDSLRMELLRAANWKKGDIIVSVTLASGVSEESYAAANKAFNRLTGETCVKFDSAAVRNPQKLDSLRKAKIIYLGGGSQSRFMELIEGTSVQEILKQAYYNGAVIGGTSAGAAVMSKKMVTGNGLRDTAYASTFKILQKGNLEIVKGLGLLDSVIIDQHFVVRSRYSRMLSAIFEYPQYQCFGIDESTAVIVHNGRAKVVGESQVIVFSKPKDIHTGNDNAFAASSVQLSIYVAGESFSVKQ